MRREAGFKKVWHIDFTRSGHGWKFNPLDPPRHVHPLEAAKTVAAAFERCLEGDMMQMRRLMMIITSVSAILIEGGRCEGGKATLHDVLDFVGWEGDDIRKYIAHVDGKRRDRGLGPVRPDLVSTYLGTLFSGATGNAKLDLTQSTWNAAGALLLTAIVNDFVDSVDSNLDMEAVAMSRQSLIVELPNVGFQAQTILGSLLLSQFSLLVSKRDITAVKLGKITRMSVYLDEFQELMGEKLTHDIAQHRNLGVSYVLMHQTSNQFATEDERTLLNAVKDNASTHIYMKQGLVDSKTSAELLFKSEGRDMVCRTRTDITENESTTTGRSIARMLGHMVAKAESETHSKGESIAIGESEGRARSTGKNTGIVETETLTISKGESHMVAKTQSGTVTLSDSHTLVEGRSEAEGKMTSESTGHGTGSGESSNYGLMEGGMSTMNLASATAKHSHGSGKNNSKNSTYSLGSAISNVIEFVHSSSRGQSRGIGTTKGSTKSKGRSLTKAEGKSLAKSLSFIESLTNTITKSLSQTKSKQHSLGLSFTESWSESLSITQQESRTKGRSTSIKTEFYSIQDEIQMRSYELQSLGIGEAWVYLNTGKGRPSAVKIKTHHIPDAVQTRLGQVDFAEELRGWMGPPTEASAEPTEDLLTRFVNNRKPRGEK